MRSLMVRSLIKTFIGLDDGFLKDFDVSTKVKLVLKGSTFRVLQTITSIVIGILMMPFLIATLGKELYGLWIGIGSIVGTYYLLDLGFNQAVTRYAAQYIHQEKPEEANRIINTALLIYSALGVVVLLASILAAIFGTKSLMTNPENIQLAQAILIITGFSLALEFPAKAFPGIISAYMRYDFISIVRLSKSILDAVLIYAFLSRGYGLVAMALITLVTGLMSTAIYVWFSTGLFKQLRFSRASIDLATLKDVFHFSKWVFLLDLSAMLRNKMDIWFILYFMSSSVLTIYYVAVRLIEYALQFLTQATGITGPLFTECYAKGETEKLIRLVTLFIKTNLILGTTTLVGFYLFATSFIDIWMSGNIDTHEAYVCLIILSIGRLTIYFTNPLNSFLLTINKHFFDAWVTLFELVASFFLCLVLVPYGIKGVAVAIAIPYLIGRLVILPVFVSRYLAIDFKNLVLRLFIYWALALVICLYVAQEIPSLKSLSLGYLLLLAPCAVLLSVALGCVLWNKEEIKWIYSVFTRKLKIQK